MISVGIRELKAKLSSYVDKVRQGKEIVITEHGQEAAVIIPISRERVALRLLVRLGRAQWSGQEKPHGVRGIKMRGKPLSATVLEERR